MTSATIHNFGNPKTVKVGDSVGFKSDYEQYGTITGIRRAHGRVELTLHHSTGFGGEYLRYATTATVDADDCWV